MADEVQPTYCAQHPQIETYLRCGQCLTPICPKCLVQTPVGARCRKCARLSRLPVYDVQPKFLLRGALAGLAAAVAGGAVLSAIGLRGFFLLILGGLLGIGVAAAMNRATNYKRGSSLGWTAVAAIVIGFPLGRLVLVLVLVGSRSGGFFPPGVFLAALRPDLTELLLLGVAALVAYTRLR
jgi:hypothetical protein